MVDQLILEKEWVDCLFCRSKQPFKPLHTALPAVVRCETCGLVYANPRIKKEAVSRLYSKEYFESHSSEAMGYDNYVSDKELVEKTFRRRLTGIEKKWVREKGRVLDVGCATGFFLSIAREMGWEPSGVEISEYCCQYARENFGLELTRGFFEEAESLKPGFRLITMWDYLEHSFAPDKDIKRAYELLAPGGILAVATPDVGSLPEKIFKQNWMGFKEHEHLYYFTQKNLSQLLKKEYFEVLSTSYIGKYISPHFFAKRLSGYSKFLGMLAGKIVSWPLLKGRSFYCNPFDIIYIVAQRPLLSFIKLTSAQKERAKRS